MLSLSDIRTIGKSARSKPPIVLGNCDYIAKEFRKEVMQVNENIDRTDIVLPVVHVIDNKNRQYTDGHTIIKIKSNLVSDYNKSEFLYIDLSLDQFCDENYEGNYLINISYGDKKTIEKVKIMNETQANKIYNFTDKNL